MPAPKVVGSLLPHGVAPFGAAYVGVLYAGYKVYKSTCERVDDIKAKLDEAFDVVLQQQLRIALDKLRSATMEMGSAAGMSAAMSDGYIPLTPC